MDQIMEENIDSKIKADVKTNQTETTKPDMEIKSSTSGSTEETEYAASYLKTGISRGITYQVKLLTWIAWKLMYKNESVSDWWLATEVRDARGFHDMVLKYVPSEEGDSTPNRKYLYRFVQIKHKMNLSEVAKISVGSLMSEKHIERQYSLIYLFKSYLNMLKKFEGITPDQIVDLTIFTNKDIGALKFLVPVAKDGIFDFEGKGKRYRMDIPMFQIDSRMLTCLRQVRSDDALILGFLKKLVFAVGQPCEPELEELITRDMGRLYRFPDFFYNDLYKSIIEWFLSYDNGKAPYLTKRHVTENLAKTHHMLLQAKNVEEVFTTNALSKLTDEMKSLSLSLSSPSLSPQSSAGFTI